MIDDELINIDHPIFRDNGHTAVQTPSVATAKPQPVSKATADSTHQAPTAPANTYDPYAESMNEKNMKSQSYPTAR